MSEITLQFLMPAALSTTPLRLELVAGYAAVRAVAALSRTAVSFTEARIIVNAIEEA